MKIANFIRHTVATLLAIAALCSSPAYAQSRKISITRADENPMSISDSRVSVLMENFSTSRAVNTQQSGEQLYQAICQGCHMPQGQGSRSGAGLYPPLANNPKLAAGAYPAWVVTNGLRGMPSFGTRLNDQQIAEVTNYVRAHFGNSFLDGVKPSEVKALRTSSPVR